MRRPMGKILILAAALGVLYAAYGVFERHQGAAIDPGWLDPDQIGDIALNLCRSGEFAERPGMPTLLRGPAFPGLLALPCLLTGVEPSRLAPILNGLCHALTLVVLALHPVARAAPARLAALAVVGLDPLLFNYAGRTYLEPMLVLSVEMVLVAFEAVRRRAGIGAALALGAALGFSLLVKPILLYFLPLMLLVLVPSGLRAVRAGAVAVLVAGLCVLPWTLRNHAVSGQYVPVATGAWEIVLKGETFSRHMTEAYGIMPLEALAKERLAALNARLGIAGLSAVEREPYYRAVAIDELRHPIWSLPHRMAIQSVALWLLGGDRRNTLVFAALQLPVLLLAILAVWRLRAFAPNDLVGIGALAGYLILVHSATLAIARYSMPLRPWLVLLAALAFIPRLRSGGLSDARA
ncbi:MAG TPA: hypothetical protein VFQ07_01955 [Candidatus Polarisedimenticolia bacterium]|nr:hypothetical protein [Candidatus Polarisedimenticolia bacterium]